MTYPGVFVPNILSIAGSDPSGGAGIQADIKAISANGGYAMAALTALTAQNTRGVQGAQLIAPDFLRAQLDSLWADIRIDAIKIGMLGSAALVHCVAQALRDHDPEGRIPVVLDPVMVAKGGDRLLAAEAVAALREVLVPRAHVITPNLPEAADLLEVAPAQDREGMQDQAARLLALGPRAVLMKGGHLADGQRGQTPGQTPAASPDLLLQATGATWLEGPRIATANTHGTGCTLSSALATQIARTGDLIAATRAAKDYIARAIAHADGLSVGSGHGPTDHFPMFRAPGAL